MARTSLSITATKSDIRGRASGPFHLGGCFMAQTQSFSFELFPPRTPEGVAKLPAIVEQLAAVQPNYFSVTFGAGGSNQEGTYDTVVKVVEHTGVDAAPHLTCVGSTRANIAALLQALPRSRGEACASGGAARRPGRRRR